MNRLQAEETASAIVESVGSYPRCTVGYLYTRGTYAVIIYAHYGVIVLLDDEAVRVYLENHTGLAKLSADDT